ncbi:phosphohydrolase [Enterovirga aerilata]|uniref:Phosphohydrolase n=1 Tax=Enterovirga aerilata TaxID=2730920 RepID=A0A849ILE9_9HYPH|nr:phosphohydrolase [Enterovirga sp. DB1703]NNM74783.1 phosphohydrolase [Enterovirga sp. DB1703]
MERKGDWMQTFSGRQFWPLDPQPKDIKLVDIAHALSMQCRYAGHVNKFYSVAEHSVHVSNVLPTITLQKWGLLHDAAEAYLVDVPRPLKPYLAGYKDAEERLLQAIAERFRLPWPIPDLVKLADNSLLADEKEQLMAKEPAPWVLPAEKSGVRIKAHPPDVAKQLFLMRADELKVDG